MVLKEVYSKCTCSNYYIYSNSINTGGTQGHLSSNWTKQMDCGLTGTKEVYLSHDSSGSLFVPELVIGSELFPFIQSNFIYPPVCSLEKGKYWSSGVRLCAVLQLPKEYIKGGKAYTKKVYLSTTLLNVSYSNNVSVVSQYATCRLGF